MSKLFISHSSKDNAFVRELRWTLADLKQFGSASVAATSAFRRSCCTRNPTYPRIALAAWLTK